MMIVNCVLLKNRLLNVRIFGSSLNYYLSYGPFVHLKFAIARHLHFRHDWCWSELVTWSLRWPGQPWYQPLTNSGRDHLKSHSCCGCHLQSEYLDDL